MYCASGCKGTILIVITSLAFTCFTQDFNPIDAVTSASKEFKLISGKAFTDKAEIVWWDKHNSGSQHLLKWGLSVDTFTNQVNLKPFTEQTDITTTITGLKANTKYYAQVYRMYEGKTHNADFTFTTYTATNIKQPPLQFSTIDGNGKTMTIYTPEGRLVSTMHGVPGQPMQGLLQIRMQDRSMAPGTYIVTINEKQSGVCLTTMKRVVLK